MGTGGVVIPLALAAVAGALLGEILGRVLNHWIDRIVGRSWRVGVGVVVALALTIGGLEVLANHDTGARVALAESRAQQSTVTDAEGNNTPTTTIDAQALRRACDKAALHTRAAVEDSWTQDANGIHTVAGVANATCGDVAYEPRVGAAYEQVVKAHVYYEIDSDPTHDDLTVSFKVTQSGETSLIHGTVTTTRGAATSTTAVDLGRDDAYLDVMSPVTWRHDTGIEDGEPVYETKVIENQDPMRGVRLDGLEGNRIGTVAVLFRVRIASIGVRIEASDPSSGAWAEDGLITHGQPTDLRVIVTNLGNTVLRAPTVRLAIPDGLTLVGTTYIAANDGPSVPFDHRTLGAGYSVGDLNPGEHASVYIQVVSTGTGSGLLEPIAVVRWIGGREYHDSIPLTVS